MNIGKLILHYANPSVTANLARMVPEAIIVDNGSRTDFKAIGIGNQVIAFDDNLGFTPNWNRAIAYVNQYFPDHEAYWLMNSDIVINRDSIRRIEQVMDDPGVAMVTPSYNCWMHECRNRGKKQLREVKCIEFTAPVIRKDVFDKIGMFDESFVRGYGVELDYALRMKKAGLKLFCDDLSTFHHIGQQTINATGTLRDYEKKAVEELKEGMSRIYGPLWRSMVQRELNVFKPKNHMRVAIYTTIFGAYAKLYPMPEQTMSADLICITDDSVPELADPEKSTSWKIVQEDIPRHDFHPRMKAKFFKLFPWECKELRNYDVVIFIDGSIEVKSEKFVEHCIATLGKNDMALYKHPQRSCIYEEAKASYPLEKYKAENIKGQIEHYRPMYPENAGLYACGIMVRKLNSSRMHEVMGSWWWEIEKYTWQDQISLPVVCRLKNFTPVTFPESQVKNEYFKIHWHDDPKTAKK